MNNTLKTGFLLTAFTVLLLLVGEMLGRAFNHGSFIFIFFGISVIINIVSWWYSDKIVLAMYGAKEVTESEAPGLYRIVANLAQKANLPMPKVCIIPSESPNAFATGRNPNHAAVAVTQGIMRILNTEEIEGVLAHELAHVKNRDTLISTAIAIFAGLIMTVGSIARWGMILGGGSRDNDNDGAANIFLAIVAPVAAFLIQMAISRQREFLADATGAQITRNPAALASALMKLEQGIKYAPMDASPATSHLFIASPFSAKSFLAIMSTHPTTEKRVANLRNVGREMGQIF